nr:MAG TPA: hypothetical protein [Bacteriophage sp.]
MSIYHSLQNLELYNNHQIKCFYRQQLNILGLKIN